MGQRMRSLLCPAVEDADRDGFGDNQNGKEPDACRGSGALPALTGGGALTVTTTVGLTLTMHSQKTQPNGQMKTVVVTGITPLCKIRMTVQRNGNSTTPGRIGCPPLPDKDNDGVPDEDDLCDKQGMNQIQQRENTCWQAIFAGDADWKTQGAMVLGFLPLLFTIVLAPILFRRQD